MVWYIYLLCFVRWLSKDRTWSVVPNALLGVIKWSSGVRAGQDTGVNFETSWGRFGVGMAKFSPKEQIWGLGGQAWGLEDKFEAWRVDLRPGRWIWGLEGWFEVLRADISLYEVWRACFVLSRAKLRSKTRKSVRWSVVPVRNVCLSVS